MSNPTRRARGPRPSISWSRADRGQFRVKVARRPRRLPRARIATVPEKQKPRTSGPGLDLLVLPRQHSSHPHQKCTFTPPRRMLAFELTFVTGRLQVLQLKSPRLT